MKSVIALFAFGAVVVTTPAMAWDPTASAAASGGSATSSATAHSGAYATGGRATGGTANVTVNGAGGGENGASGGGLTGNVPVASAVAPGVFSANPCSGSGVSGGVSTSILGLSFGSGNRFDDVCRLVSVGKPQAAFELLCRDDDVREAAKAAGTPCAADRPKVTQAVFVDDNTRPDWCDTASPAELRKYAAVCGSNLQKPIRKPGE